MPPLPPRLAPQTPLPPYSYVTGKFPHPIRDPAGHSYGREDAPSSFDVRQWRHCHAYCFGVDLFNAGYYWEAHESWEAAWHGAGRSGPTADFLKALIKLAAAGVKAREGRPGGIRAHARRAEELIGGIEETLADENGVCGGLQVAELLDACRTLQSQVEELVDASDEPVVRVLPFVLRPVDR